MKAEEVIKLIQTLEPSEIEKLFVLIKEYETEVRRSQASTRYIPMDDNFEKTVDKVFAENFAGDDAYRLHLEIQRNKPQHEDALRAGDRNIGTVRVIKL